MLNSENKLGWLKVEGSSFEISQAMGEMGRDALHQYLIPSALWNEIQAHKDTAKIE